MSVVVYHYNKMLCFVFILIPIAAVYGRRTNQIDGKIVGGKNASIKDFPYQLSIEYSGRHDCGASLIKPNVALTAAHCTGYYIGKEAFLSVRAGSSILEKGGHIAKVLTMCDHPKFNRYYSNDYDVSLLLLNRSFALGANVRTIRLPRANWNVPVGTVANISGWGNLKWNGSLSKQLQVVKVPKVKDSICKRLYAGFGTVTNRMECFGFMKGGKDTCQGDSGGPLAIDGTQVGVISWGIGCGLPRLPSVYTKVTHPEIRKHISDCLKKFLNYN